MWVGLWDGFGGGNQTVWGCVDGGVAGEEISQLLPIQGWGGAIISTAPVCLGRQWHRVVVCGMV